MTLRYWRTMGWLPLILCLTACSGIVAPDQTTNGLPPATLRVGETVGQTFVARQMGLAGVEVYLDPNLGTAAGDVRLSLRPEYNSPVELASATLPAAAIQTPGYYRFNLPPQWESRQVYYAIELELQGGGELRVGQGSADSYLDGAMYHNDEPSEAQMMFRLVYDTPLGLLGLALMVGEWVVWSVAGLALFVLPGWATLSCFWPSDAPLDGMAKFGIAVSLSVATYPVLMLWTHLIGLQLGWAYAWLPVLMAAGAIVWRRRSLRPDALGMTLLHWRQSETFWADLTMIVVVALTFGLRYWLIRSQEAPMWGDSVHHTMIAQLMLDNGGLFESWLPYAELSTFTYHFGFHTAVAVFAWLTGLDSVRAVMWAGQILNGLAVLALWPLVLRLSGNRWAAVAAVIVAGLLSPMPNYYVNWGRYTQLAGQVILPGAMALAWWVIDRRSTVPRAVWVLGALMWSGLALTHYRVLIFGILFMIVLIPAETLSQRWRMALIRPALLGLSAFALFLPWFVRVFGGRLVGYFAIRITTPPTALSDFDRQYNSLGDVTFYLPVYLWGVLLVVLLVTLVRRHRAGSVMVGWGGLVLLAANPQWVGLPGSGLISSPAVMMGAYMLVAVLIGAACGWLVVGLDARVQQVGVQMALASAVSLAALAGLRQRFADYRPDLHAMVTRPDTRAMEWIQTDTPGEARFLVNSFFAYGGGLIVGSDAGWWLPQLAGRLTTLPPMLYGSEQELDNGNDLQHINTRAAKIEQLGPAAPETGELLRTTGIAFVFVAQRGGMVGNPQLPWLDVATLRTSDLYRQVYHEDHVWVFALNP